jgi:hypothetical protein
MLTSVFTGPSTAKLLLKLAGFSDETEITFAEDADPQNLYGLSLACDDVRLTRKIAGLFGCPASDLPEGDYFENSDSWTGPIRFRDVADELTPVIGPFFEETLTLGELREIAGEAMAQMRAGMTADAL